MTCHRRAHTHKRGRKARKSRRRKKSMRGGMLQALQETVENVKKALTPKSPGKSGHAARVPKPATRPLKLAPRPPKLAPRPLKLAPRPLKLAPTVKPAHALTGKPRPALRGPKPAARPAARPAAKPPKPAA